MHRLFIVFLGMFICLGFMSLSHAADRVVVCEEMYAEY